MREREGERELAVPSKIKISIGTEDIQTGEEDRTKQRGKTIFNKRSRAHLVIAPEVVFGEAMMDGGPGEALSWPAFA